MAIGKMQFIGGWIYKWFTEFFFNNDINNSECKKCAYKYLCGGPCKAVSYNLTGSLLEGRGEYCKHAKKECQEYLRSIQFGGES